MSRYTAILIITLIGALSIAHADNVYRWVDAHGVVHYTDQWRPGAKLIMTDVPQPLNARSHSKAWAGIAAESDATRSTIRKQQAERIVAKDEAEQRAEQCKQARARYSQLIQAHRIYSKDSSGQREYLSNSAITAARVKALEAMTSLCGTQSGS